MTEPYDRTANCRNLRCTVITYAYSHAEGRPECPACALRDQVARVRDLAEYLRPTKGSPCENAEACCGSAESCDALYPSVRVVGRESILRALGENS